jgi:hypothetical protein
MKPIPKPEYLMSATTPPASDKAPVQLGEDDKYIVDIFSPPKAVPTPKEFLEAIKGAVKGKMLAKMKKEAVDCPVKLKVVSFVECFTCPNFNRRIRGKVGCKGLPLPPQAKQ